MQQPASSKIGFRAHLLRDAALPVAYDSVMLFMVIETFRDGDAQRVGSRYEQAGRMLPDGVTYHASWVERSGSRCFQIMEAADAADFEPWTSAWADLVEFEIVAVETSAAFWAQRR